MDNFQYTQKQKPNTKIMWNSRRKYLPTIGNVLLIVCCLCLQVESKQHDLSLSTAIRSARLMRFLSEPTPNVNHNRRVGPGQIPRVPARADSLHPLPAWRSPLPPPALVGPQVIRREYNANWPYGGANQANRFSHSKDAAVLDVGKNQFYRLKDGQQYLQFHSNQYSQNFKASPHFNGNVAVKNEPNKFPIYPPIQQHAIPVEASKYITYKQEQGYGDISSKQTFNQHGQLAHVQSHNNYAVYEDAENVAKSTANFGFNYQQPAAVAPQKVSKEAENYLHFMSTNEYFLPKREPNYKLLDVDREQISYQQQKQIQQELQQQQQPQPQQQPLQTVGERKPLDSRVSSSYNKPLRVSDLFYQQDPAPSNSAVVRGSYQAGQNAFVVKSDGNKSVKHILSTSLSTKTTQAPPAVSYTQVWHSAPKTETPEPLRFEFTEHDAIKGSASYTNAPQGQKFYYETHTSTPYIPPISSAPISENEKPIKTVVHDLKENTEYVDKRPQEQTVSEPANAPIETAEHIKDPEAYCEKICANVYDENDEIICGSDGYMYTGESQLECYSSCLNIEVSIKSKGSCA